MPMRRKTATALPAIITAGVLLSSAFAATAPASAASVAPLASACKSSPSDAHRDGVDPNTSGCATDAYTVGWVAYNQYLPGLGKIELRYSPSCKTNWARWQYSGADDGNTYQMYVLRKDGKGAWDTCTASGCQAWVTGHTTDFWSPMTYSPVQKAQACVITDDGSDPKFAVCTPFM